MSGSVSLQADVAQTSLATLSSLQPFLRALSGDDVHPMAVLQVESLGTCFHVNGELAKKVPDLLVRCKSIRLERISQWVGWMAGDTASVMAKTTGGRAASLLALIMVETYGEEDTGELLYELSSKLLPSESNVSSMAHLGRVAKVLSNKLGSLAYGTHLALHVTRIREAYFNAGLQIPRNLLDSVTINTMVDILVDLRTALTEEHSILYFEGCQGLGNIVALLLAICPDDVSLAVENEIIFQGTRRSVVISIKAGSSTRFGVETIILDKEPTPLCHILSIRETQGLGSCSVGRYKWDGFLALQLDLACLRVGLRATPELRSICANLIISMVFRTSRDRDDRPSRKSEHTCLMFPRRKFQRLLGPLAHNRVQDSLKRTLRAEPSFISTSELSAFDAFVEFILALVPTSLCGGHYKLNSCVNKDTITTPSNWLVGFCFFRQFLREIGYIIDQGVASLFVTCVENATLNASLSISGGIGCWHSKLADIRRRKGFLGRLGVHIDPIYDSSVDGEGIHGRVLQLLGNVSVRGNPIGNSCGSFSIFPTTLQNPVLDSNSFLEYRVEEGQFHDGIRYYTHLYTDRYLNRRTICSKGISLPGPGIVPSPLGIYDNLLITAQPNHTGLKIRAIISVSGKTVEANFYAAHIAFINVTNTSSCKHNPRTPLHTVNSKNVIATSVIAPAPQPKILAITLTKDSPESAFFCGSGVEALLQCNCCLNCAVMEAREKSCWMVIQS